MKELLSQLQAQAAIEAGAYQRSMGMLLWAKTMGFRTSHKALGRFNKAQRRRLKNIGKFIVDYAGGKFTVPAVAECACDEESLFELWTDVYGLMEESQAGWKAIAANAQGEEATDIDAYADTQLDKNIDAMKDLRRLLQAGAKVGDDFAACLAWDKRFKEFM